VLKIADKWDIILQDTLATAFFGNVLRHPKDIDLSEIEEERKSLEHDQRGSLFLCALKYVIKMVVFPIYFGILEIIGYERIYGKAD